jgi:ABC-type nitrate/sulfonate/bicarbonate transport system substrate-binding protein
MTPWAQGLYIMPGRGIRTLVDLEGKTVAVNAPDNILYLLVAGALADHGLSVSGVKLKRPDAGREHRTVTYAGCRQRA